MKVSKSILRVILLSQATGDPDGMFGINTLLEGEIFKIYETETAYFPLIHYKDDYWEHMVGKRQYEKHIREAKLKRILK